ncbi:MAG TPA: ROK family protein [Candidatus Saccharimonadales bacterium]|nr:ROK family protein [Candidatus Saccharimonadales bacterium]
MVTAIDIGATKTLIAQFDASMNPTHEIRFETNQDSLIFLNELKSHLLKFSHVSVIVAGVPGIVSHDGVILKCGNLPWKNFNLAAELSNIYDCPVFIENDASLAALSEVNLLKPIPVTGLYLTISTGIGGGIIVGGRLLDGLKQSEPGHILIKRDGLWSEWEDFASGSAIKKQFGKLARDIESDEDWQLITENIAEGLYALIPVLQPNVIIFGGGVGKYFDRFEHMLTEKLSKNLPEYISRPKLTEAKHPDEAVLYGCYYYAQHQIQV